ncbi:hypothetical protein EWM64_g6137 [Hericium alpestre]|uniref:Alpha/beta hydrolase fold-3 domain-containing protein n=1 Tax=Hericium alpestre TaxID=135208 RepID=A0A4Y9ZV07_9AGAM|nr:hypothetical protein EWM64_g6137 [Hericium alpestre]
MGASLKSEYAISDPILGHSIMSQYAHLSIVDPEFAKAAANVPPPEPTDDIQLRRERFNGLIKMLNERDKALLPPESELRVEEHKVPVDGGEITVRYLFLLSPSPRTLNVPHGKAAENTTLLSADLSKGFVVRGTSSGGNLAASMALRTRDDPFFQGRPLTGQILQIPAVVSPHNIPEKYKAEFLSMYMPLDPRFFDKSGVLDYNRLWNPDVTDIYTFPLLHPNHAGLAPAVIQICGLDPLRDEGLLYERLLREAGVKTKLYTYAGVPHGFYVPFSEIKVAKEYNQDLKDGLRWLLSGAI